MKTRVVAVTLALLFLVVLAWLSGISGAPEHSGLMLVRQPPGTMGRISPATARSLRDEGLLLTYEIPAAATVEALNSRHRVTLVGTNSCYLDVTGYRLVSGGFFPHSAWEGERRQAALNKTAAAQIFGSTNIDQRTVIIGGHVWIVTGVVDDGAGKALNIYAPSSVTGGHARSLMIVTQGGSAGWAQAASALAGFGIREGEYDFIDLFRATNAGTERFSLSWKIALGLAIILLGAKGLSVIKAICVAFAKDLASHYPREILAKRRADIAKATAVAGFLAGGAAALMNISLRILVTVMGWREVSLPQWYPGADFAEMINWMQDYHTIGTWVFVGYLVAILTVAVQIVTRRKGHGGNITEGDMQGVPRQYNGGAGLKSGN